MKIQAKIWWSKLSLEEKFYKTIAANTVIEGDRTRHPESLTEEDIYNIYEYHSNQLKIRV